MRPTKLPLSSKRLRSMPRSLTPTLPLLAVLLPLLAACAGATPSSPTPVNACTRIALPPRLDSADRAKLADEIDAAPGAVWVGVLTDAARVESDLRACQAVK